MYEHTYIFANICIFTYGIFNIAAIKYYCISITLVKIYQKNLLIGFRQIHIVIVKYLPLSLRALIYRLEISHH